uniref:C2 domain-containing protein n=1 Tax=Vannella robusta TaxID=1487602 RepID=A0A7S4IT96_9EUKA
MPSSESINDSEDFDSDNEVYDEDEDSDETKFVKSNSNLLNRLLEDDDELQEDSNNCDSDFDTAEENSNSEEQTNHSGEGNDMITDRSGISLEKSSGISLEKENEENTKGISLDKEPQPESRICLDKSESEEKTSSISLEKKEESEGTKSSNEKDETKEEETKKEEPESAEPAKKNPRLTDVKSDTPRLEHRTSSLREKLRKDNANKKDFVKINLETLSAIAVADIKRSSMSSTAIVDVEIAKAKGLHPVKSGPPSPMCLLAIRKDTNKDHEKKIELKKAHEQTSVLPKNSCPAWNEKKEIKLDQVKGESQRYLVLEIRDKGPKGEFLGFIELNLNNIADLVQREEWFTLQKRKKKDKVSGEILLRTRIRPEV